MKTNSPYLWVSLLTLALTGPGSFAQDDNSSSDNSSSDNSSSDNSSSDNPANEAPDATTVVYDAPVAYYASVVYQAPVIYNAPVFYVAAATVAASCAAQAQAPEAEPASTVCVIGGNDGAYTYSNDGSPCAGSTVIQFGQRGGWFGLWW